MIDIHCHLREPDFEYKETINNRRGKKSKLDSSERKNSISR